MELNRALRFTLCTVTALTVASAVFANDAVTIDNFARAQTDVTMSGYVKEGALGKFVHQREPVAIDKQAVIRMNRDTIYSFAVLDLTDSASITKPDPEGRYQSMMVLDQDQYVVSIEYGKGDFSLTSDQVGTRYGIVIVRTFVDANDPADIKAANALQDRLTIQQDDVGNFDVPDWDSASLKNVRDALNVLASSRDGAKGMFGSRGEVTQLNHLLGAAYGWGGLPDDAAVYANFVPDKNDGQTAYVLQVGDVPVNGFWSVTVYGKDGFMVENDQNAYSYNNVTATKNADGGVTINFGGGADAVNNLPITPGWNFIVRMYQPEKQIIDGSWKFPQAEPAN